MIKSKLALTCLLASLPVVGASTMISACAPTQHQESTGQYVDSSTITVKIKSKLLADKNVKSLPITVKTYKNTVQLSGFVDNAQQKAEAVAIANQVVNSQGGDVNYVVKDSLVVK